nr:hypothetical protein [Tanacetum cinerariifolium]
MVLQNISELGKGSTMPTNPHHTPTILQPSSSQPQKTQKPKKPKRKDTQVPQPSGPTEYVTDEAVHKKLGDSLVRDATTTFSLEAEQDSGNINRTQSKATPNEPSSQGTNSGGGPRVLDLEKTKNSQRNEIDSLKRRVKKHEKRNSIATTNITNEEITLAQALDALKTSKPKVKGIVIQEQEEPRKSTTTKTIATIRKQQSQEKDLQERERAVKEKKANIALIETWDDIQAKIDDDHRLAERLQEQEELSDAEKATLFQQFLEKRRKHFAAKRVEEKRNKPPTQSQKRKIMCTYLKNIEGYKLKDLKLKEFDFRRCLTEHLKG